MANCCFGNKRPRNYTPSPCETPERRGSFSSSTSRPAETTTNAGATMSEGTATPSASTNGPETNKSRVTAESPEGVRSRRSSNASDETQYLPEPLSDPERDDYYAVLGINRQADAEEVRKAYRAKALKWHPDKNHMTCRALAERQFKLISEAYQVLSDPGKRSRYDLYGRESVIKSDDSPKTGEEALHHRHRSYYGSTSHTGMYPFNITLPTSGATLTFFHPGVPPVMSYGQTSCGIPGCTGYSSCYCPGPSSCPCNCKRCSVPNTMFFSPSFAYDWQQPVATSSSSAHMSCPECNNSSPRPKYRNKYRDEGNCQLNRNNIHYPSGRATEI